MPFNAIFGITNFSSEVVRCGVLQKKRPWDSTLSVQPKVFYFLRYAADCGLSREIARFGGFLAEGVSMLHCPRHINHIYLKTIAIDISLQCGVVRIDQYRELRNTIRRMVRIAVGMS